MSAVYYTVTCIFVLFIVGTTSSKSQSFLSGGPYRRHKIHVYYTPELIRYRFTRMMRELICDADAKVLSIQHMKRQFAKSGKYHVGELIFNVRNRYGFMMRKLRESEQWQTRFKEDHDLVKPTLRFQTMYQDIDHMAAMVSEYDKEDPSGRLYGRMGPIVAEDENIEEGSILRTRNLKQKEYMERKKKEWAIVKGYDTTNKSTRLMLRNKNKEEGGFDSDNN